MKPRQSNREGQHQRQENLLLIQNLNISSPHPLHPLQDFQLVLLLFYLLPRTRSHFPPLACKPPPPSHLQMEQSLLPMERSPLTTSLDPPLMDQFLPFWPPSLLPSLWCQIKNQRLCLWSRLPLLSMKTRKSMNNLFPKETLKK